jgi:DNA-binding MarR family transcriptional regulator
VSRPRKPELLLIPDVERATHAIGLYIASHDLGLVQAEANVLAYLAAHGSTPLSELHQSFGHRRSTLTSVVDRLERRELVRRSTHPDDARALVITPTNEGLGFGRRIAQLLRTVEQAVLDRCTPSDVRGFHRVIETLLESIRQ